MLPSPVSSIGIFMMNFALVIGLMCLGLGVARAQDTEDSKEDDLCMQPPSTAVCRAAIPSWYFDGSSGACKEFIYGGCPGSKNLFPTKETCIRRCQPEVCLMPHDVGPCRANIRSWFYDAENRACREFSYGGCEGNENRFTTQHGCEQACAGSNLPCEMSDKFQTVGNMNVHQGYRESEFFLYSCSRRCKEQCLNEHPWGLCQGYSTRKRWYGCYCYLYDRALSEEEFDHDTSGVTRNRLCATE